MRLEEIIRRNIKRVVNEVRYLNNHIYTADETPIHNDDTIRVYHGCKLKTAVQFAIEGLSGKQGVGRVTSYEMGMNPVGLFVSTSFDTVKEFASSSGDGVLKNGDDVKAAVIIEFTAKASDLDTPVWAGSDSYYGFGSLTPQFGNKEERDAQKGRYNNDAATSEYSCVRDSDNKAMASTIFTNPERQALFLGDLNPNMIKRFWVCPRGTDSYIPLNRKEFLKRYGDVEFTYELYGNKKEKFKRHKVYNPNEDYQGFDEFVRRLFIDAFPEATFDNLSASDETWLKDTREFIQDAIKYREWDTLSYYLWPKQLHQLLGHEEYNKAYDKYGIGFPDSES